MFRKRVKNGQIIIQHKYTRLIVRKQSMYVTFIKEDQKPDS